MNKHFTRALPQATAVAALVALMICDPLPADAGSAKPGEPFDLQGFINREVESGKKRVVIPPGRYRVSPVNRQHLLLKDLKDVQIIANGVEMTCTETTRAVTITHCTNVVLQGLAIDYDPLPFTQGRITGFGENKTSHEIELFEGYPPAETARNFKYEVFRPDTRTLRCEDRYLSKVEVLDSRHLRLHRPGGKADDPEQIGDLVVIGAEFAPHGSAAHAVECNGNTNVRLEGIVLFASNCFGFLENNCDGTQYVGCRIDRRPLADDPVKRASPRLRSLDADAFHSKHAIKGPAYLGCVARFMGDDAVNICGDYHMVMSSDGRDLRVLAKHDLNLQPGDPVELVQYTGERLPDAKVVEVKPAPSLQEDERAFLARQRMDEALRTARGALNKGYLVTLDREMTIPRGGVLCAANRIGNGFVVKGCEFGQNRSRGILIKASHGEVSGNRLEGSWMSAILVAPEYWWLEAGSSSDLRITGNKLTACKGIPICIEATAGNGDVAPAGAHRNLTITGNTIKECPMPGILVCATSGLRLEGNQLELTAQHNPLPGGVRKAAGAEVKPVMQVNCTP